MRMLGTTQMTVKESEHQNSSILNPNASGTKNTFGMTDMKMETKMSKVSEKEREKTQFEQ